jgi:hypothetical protein
MGVRKGVKGHNPKGVEGHDALEAQRWASMIRLDSFLWLILFARFVQDMSRQCAKNVAKPSHPKGRIRPIRAAGSSAHGKK